MLGDGARQAIIVSEQNHKRTVRALLSLDLKLPKKGENPYESKDFFLTAGQYAVIYKPTDMHGRKRKKPIVISTDIKENMCISIINWRDFIQATKRDPYWEFVYKYTNICEEMIRLAYFNPIVRIPFMLDFIKLEKAIKRKNKKAYEKRLEESNGKYVSVFQFYEYLRDEKDKK